MKYFLLTFTLLLIPFALFASNTDISISKGITQDVIVHLSPSAAQEDVLGNTKIEVLFSVPLDVSAIKKHDVKLRHLSSKTNDSISGSISYTQTDKKFTFTPHAPLDPGLYEVEIKSLKAQQKEIKIKEIKYRFVVIDEINGHRLPPEPDPAINNSTLLGIDSNNNGVRDDVERWIYETYKDKHPIHIDIAMQAARAYKKVLEMPEKAKEIREIVNAPIYCQGYYKVYAKYFNKPILVHERIDSKVFNKYFNTKERKDVYWQYDTLLSGGMYTLPKIGQGKKLCDFNTSQYEE